MQFKELVSEVKEMGFTFRNRPLFWWCMPFREEGMNHLGIGSYEVCMTWGWSKDGYLGNQEATTLFDSEVHED